MNLQDLVDGMSQRMKRERAATQMTLGEMIKRLEALPQDLEIEGLGEAISYRGYYADLAFIPVKGTVRASELLARCRACMGEVFLGYKGGEYVMGALTPVWVAEYGDLGRRLMEIRDDGTLLTVEEQ